MPPEPMIENSWLYRPSLLERVMRMLRRMK